MILRFAAGAWLLTLIACSARTRRVDAPSSNERPGAVPSVSAATDGPEAFLVRTARQEQNAAIAARDFDRVASYWSDDVTITAGLGRMLRGKAAYLQAFRADSLIVYQRNPEQIETSDQWPLAYERGRWAGRRAQGRSNEGALISGSYTAQWVKRNGRWLIRSEIFVALECADEACSWAAVP
jgi:ketosteroid isomerase-like protein